MAMAAWELGLKRLPSISQRVASNTSIVPIISHFAVRMPSGTSLGRMSDRQYLIDANHNFVPAKSEMGFDNSQAVNRYSGGGYTGAVPGLYLATRGKNGIFSSITSEAAFYTDKPGYSDLQKKKRNSQMTVDELRAYLNPALIFSPQKVVVAYESPSRLNWSPNFGLGDLQLALRDPLLELMDIMARVESDAPDSEKHKYLTQEAIQEIRFRGSNTPMSLGTALRLPVYVMSSAIGNVCLANNIAVSFDSVRADVLSSPDYMEGASNVVIPMLGGQPTDLVAKRVYIFDVATRSIISMDVYDDTGAMQDIAL